MFGCLSTDRILYMRMHENCVLAVQIFPRLAGAALFIGFSVLISLEIFGSRNQPTSAYVVSMLHFGASLGQQEDFRAAICGPEGVSRFSGRAQAAEDAPGTAKRPPFKEVCPASPQPLLYSRRRGRAPARSCAQAAPTREGRHRRAWLRRRHQRDKILERRLVKHLCNG